MDLFLNPLVAWVISLGPLLLRETHLIIGAAGVIGDATGFEVQLEKGCALTADWNYREKRYLK
jgi:hypothetical protein